MATLRQQIATNVLTATKFRDLLNLVREYRPNDDLDIIQRAYDFSLQHHSGQTRASGEPYVVHPLEVALVLAEMKLDSTAIAAGLLHDAVEDTGLQRFDIRIREETLADFAANVMKAVPVFGGDMPVLGRLFLDPHVERKLVFDLDYARRQGLVLDVRILLCTALKLFGLPAAALRKMLPVRRLDVDEAPLRRAA